MVRASKLMPISAQRLLGRFEVGQVALGLGLISLRQVLLQLRTVFLYGAAGLVQLLPVLLHVLLVGGNVLAVVLRIVS